MEMCLTREPLPDMKLCGAVRSVVPWMHLLLQQCLDGTDPETPVPPASNHPPIFFASHNFWNQPLSYPRPPEPANTMFSVYLLIANQP